MNVDKGGRTFMPGRAQVLFVETVTEEAIQKFLDSLGFTVLNKIDLVRWYLVGVPVGGEQAAVDLLKTRTDIVVAVTLDYTKRVA